MIKEIKVTSAAIKKDSHIDLRIASSSKTNVHHSNDHDVGNTLGYCHSPENASNSKLSNGPKKNNRKMASMINSTIFFLPNVLKYHNVTAPLVL